MKKLSIQCSYLCSSFLLLFILTLSNASWAQENQNNQKFQTFKGVVKNADDKSPVIFATVYIDGTTIGTVTNSDGDFLLKVPIAHMLGKIGISSLGYKTLFVPISKLTEEKNILELTPAVIPLNEVVIRHLNALDLIRNALSRIPDNYPHNPMMLTTFYRESIKKNHSFVSVGEAVLNVYKSSYTNILDNDRTTIFKGRKSQAVKNMDTLLVKLQGGPLMLSYLDLVKYPGQVLSPDMFMDYHYRVGGIVFLDGRETYEINFTQSDTSHYAFYNGSIYLDAKSLAFVSFQFEVAKNKLDDVLPYFIKKKPAGLKAELLSANYYIKYRKIGSMWYLNYVRAESEFKFKWKKKWFASNYTIVSEAAVTDIDRNNVVKPKFSERIKSRDFFTDKVSAFEDPAFWGANNIIEPEASIESAIKKISRKLKRWRRSENN
ncbi:MAG: carboxypeptidase-like regulatory domain-containing protein [Bacteroidales bacterium]|nr:carboxypeptidase-like regulatory domain-containing protein [Bacteroidales bacterium]